MERGRVVATTAEMGEGAVLYPRGCPRSTREYGTDSEIGSGAGNRAADAGASAEEKVGKVEEVEEVRAKPLIISGGELM